MGYRIQDIGYRIQDTGYVGYRIRRIQDIGNRIQGTEFRIHHAEYSIHTSYSRQDTGYWIQ